MLLKKAKHYLKSESQSQHQESQLTNEIFQKFITEYFEKRQQLVAAFVLIDIRLEAQQIDLDFINYLGESQVPFCIVFTKADKIGKTKVQQHIAEYKKKLYQNNWEEIPEYFITSAEDQTGKDDLLQYIDQINQDFVAQTNKFI